MPYHRATYDPVRAKIWATMGPYLAKINASTGQRESLTRIVDPDASVGPCYGDMSVCYHTATDTVLVGTGYNPRKMFDDVYFYDPPATRDIYKVNPDTLVITPCQIWNLNSGGLWYPCATDSREESITQIVEDGDYVHIIVEFQGGGSNWIRIHVSTLAWNGQGMWRYHREQICVDGNIVYTPMPYWLELAGYTKDQSDPVARDYGADVIPHIPTATAFAEGKVWCVNGSEILVRLDSWTNLDYTEFNLSLIPGPSVFPDPCRMQLLSDGMLYLPCMSADGIVVFNPSTGAGTWKGGFENPIDVVEAGAKKWALQASPVGLKEIT